MIKNNSKIKVKITGVNLNRIYKECQKNNIKLYNINRLDHKCLIFKIDSKNLNKIKEISLSLNYTMDVLTTYGIAKLFSLIGKRIGAVVGAFIFVILLIINSCFVWNIKIYGLEDVKAEEIIAVLNKNGLKTGSAFSTTNLEVLEHKLLDNIDKLSLCSIVKKGSTIIVNVKEKLSTINFIESTQTDLIATENMTITNLSVVQGTALKKDGDSVKKGEVIVAGYFLDVNKNKITCRANANITALTWFTETEVYQKQKEVFVRTGKKVTTSYMSLFGMKFNLKNEVNDFEHFDEEITEKYVFKNNLMPCKYTTKNYYETECQIVSQDFEKDKLSLIEKLTSQAVNKVPSEYNIERTFNTITEHENEYVVTCYAEIEIQL